MNATTPSTPKFVVTIFGKELPIHYITEDTDAIAPLVDLRNQEIIGFDTETTGLEPLSGARLRLVQFATADNIYVFDLFKTSSSVRLLIKEILEKEYPVKVGHNLKFDTKFARYHLGVKSMGRLFDTYLAAQLLTFGDITERVGLDVTAAKFLGQPLLKDEQLSDWGRRDLSESQIKYAAIDAYTVLRLREAMIPHIVSNSMERVAKIEFDAVDPVAAMELNGFYLDSARWLSQWEISKSEKHTAMEKLWEILSPVIPQQGLFEGAPLFNIGSRNNLIGYLQDFGIELPLNDSGEGYTTRNWKLTPLAAENEVIRALLDVRTASKAVSSYGEEFLSNINPLTGRIHAQFRQIGALTGRFAVNNPNLQQIPTRDGYRRCFTSSPTTKLLVADYSQIELRIMAELSGEPNFLHAFHNNIDLHTLTASRIFKKAPEDVTKAERYFSKCFHPDTEILTPQGWQKIVDITTDTTVAQAVPKYGYDVEIEWVKPLEVFTMKHRSEKLVHLHNESIDIRVTPDHRMLAYGSTGKPYDTVPLEFSKVRGYANAGMFKDSSVEACLLADERLLRLAVATQADGSYSGRRIRFGFSKARKIGRLKSLLQKEEYIEKLQDNGVTTICFLPELSEKIKQLLDGKMMPWSWLQLSQRLREVIIEEAAFWDSCCRDNWNMYRYSSVVEQNIDVLQAIASITGRKTRKIQKADGNYDLTIRANNRSRGENVETSTEEFTEEVACLSVPSTYVLVRSGGVPVITGQTINFGIAYGMGALTLAIRTGESVEYARETLQGYVETNPVLIRWLNSTARLAVSERQSRTASGRLAKYKFDSSDAEKKAMVERNGKNTPVQGLSADILKRALRLFHDAANDERYLNADGSPRVRLVNIIHDELVVEADNEVAEEFAPRLSTLMIKAGEEFLTQVPVEVETEIKTEWLKG